jgi:hypothetical protein
MKNRTKIIFMAIMMQLAMAVAAIAPVRAQVPDLIVLPATVTIPNIGDTATVDVNITDVTNLYAYEIKIWYMLSVVNTTVDEVVRPTGHLLEPVDPSKQFVNWAVDYSNGTWGVIYASFSLLAPEVGRSGSGILFRITFHGIGSGTTPIMIQYPGETLPAILVDDTGTPITHTATDGSVTVIPEFPTFLMLPMLAVTTVIVASFAKLYRRKREFN